MRIPMLKLIAVTILVLLAGSVASAQECEAELTYTYMGPDKSGNPEFVDHIAAVEVKTKEVCAQVTYTLTVVERYPDGELRTKSKSWTQKTRGESKVRKVKYRVHHKTVIESTEMKVTGCRLCGSPG